MEQEQCNISAGQLQRYRQRDLTPSHLYRLGTKLFGSEPVRHRVIDAAHYVPRELVPHAVNLRRTWDGQPLDAARRECSHKIQRRHSEQNLNDVKTSDFTHDQYRQWMEERKRVRDGLDAMAISERWLWSKTRSPLENKALAELRSKRKAAAIAASTQIIRTHSEASITGSSSSAAKNDGIPCRQSSIRHRHKMIDEVKKLVAHLLHGKQRLVTLLALHDPAGVGSMRPEELEIILLKMRAPVSQECLELVLKSLPAVEGGIMLDYQPLVRGDIVRFVNQYLDSSESYAKATLDCSSGRSGELQVSATEAECDTVQAVCTMTGDRGTLSTAHKEEEKRQFEILLEFCREKGIVLDKELVEKALLLPSDHPRESCLAALRQPGLDLLSQEFTKPPREVTKTVERRDVEKKFGWAYKELKWKRKPTLIRIPKPPEKSALMVGGAKGAGVKRAVMKRVTITPKVDCWLTFKQYQEFAREVTSRPEFNYKYHGLPDNNAFWPGALVDKLRLWLPRETLADKPYSLYNIFQPVTHPRIYNPHTPHVEQKRAWPENAQGYVQFGGDNRKSYGL